MDGGRPRKRHAAAAEVLVPESGDSSTDDDDATESEDEAAVQAAVARLSRSPDSPDVVLVNEVTAADREAAARAAAVEPRRGLAARLGDRGHCQAAEEPHHGAILWAALARISATAATVPFKMSDHHACTVPSVPGASMRAFRASQPKSVRALSQKERP